MQIYLFALNYIYLVLEEEEEEEEKVLVFLRNNLKFNFF